VYPSALGDRVQAIAAEQPVVSSTADGAGLASLLGSLNGRT
jgi:hypothetical protein